MRAPIRAVGSFLVPLALLTACAPQTVNTQRPSRADLLFRYDQLQDYLAARRVELRRLNAAIVQLDDILLGEIARLRSARRSLASLESSDRRAAEVEATEQATLGQLQADADGAYQRLLSKRIERDKLVAVAPNSSSTVPQDATKINALSTEIDALEKEIAGLERAIERTIKTRENRVLRSEEPL